LAVLAHFVGQCELLMKPADYRHLPLFCATNQRDKLSLRVELVGASINRDRALLDLIEAARHAAQQRPVCSAPVIGGDANAGQGVRCKQHESTIGLFAEDLKRNHKLAVAAGLLPAATKPEESVRGEPLDPSIDDAVHALVQSLPDMKPPAAALDQPARRHLGQHPKSRFWTPQACAALSNATAPSRREGQAGAVHRRTHPGRWPRTTQAG
jgi:ATP-dependent Lon protease